MSKLRWLGLLMGITILGLTLFQVYWLRQNYMREKNSLAIKSEMAFRETILQLQVSKFKLDGSIIKPDSTNGKVKIFLNEQTGEQIRTRMGPREHLISTIDVFRGKLKDSLRVKTIAKPGMVISFNNTSVNAKDDSVLIERTIRPPGGREGRIINLLYGVDSLQDSLRIPEIDSAYSLALKERKINIPFSIAKADSASSEDGFVFNEVTVGLAKPVTYKLKLGNTFSYLLRQIMQPILFSILLIGITVLSFVLLYRNLLKQRRLALLKNEFISNITHELKTPIATVGVAIEALKNFNAIDNPERTREYLSISQNELHRLGLLVDKVLKLSMFEKKEVELQLESVSMKDIVDEVVTSLKLQFEKSMARVSVSSMGDVTISGDRLHLLSVMFNLIDNALKYSKGDPSIHVDLKGVEQEVQVQITDNGIGIAPEYKDKLFDKFFRVPHGDTHNAKGYGLGLSYAAQVVRKHGGTITVDSQPGIGSKFTIVLPRIPVK